MAKPSKKTDRAEKQPAELARLHQKIEGLEHELGQAQEATRRSQADYQNLVRRNQEERAALIKMAGRDIIESLLEPLHHLELAAAQLNDAGLNMVVHQFRHSLEQHGLEELHPVGQPFDIETMEVVEKTKPDVDEQKAVVVEVRSKGYKLNGSVIRHAKVVLGTEHHTKK